MSQSSSHLCDISLELEALLLDEQARAHGWSSHAEMVAAEIALDKFYDEINAEELASAHLPKHQEAHVQAWQIHTGCIPF